MLTEFLLVLSCALAGAASSVLLTHSILKLFVPKAFNKAHRLKQAVVVRGALSPSVFRTKADEVLAAQLQMNWATSADICGLQYQKAKANLAVILSPTGQSKTTATSGLYPIASGSVD